MSDLVVVMLPGVQKFLEESRSTADVAASSKIMSRLTEEMVSALPAGVDVVFPVQRATGGDRGLPNRIVFVAPSGEGHAAAVEVTTAARSAWRQLCTAACRPKGNAQAATALVSESVGFPAPRWVVVASDVGGYPEQWKRVQAAVSARKRIRDFPAYDQRGEGGGGEADRHRLRICSLTGRWAAAGGALVSQVDARLRRGESLSAQALVKRAYGRREAPEGGYPSTWSVATAVFRQDVIASARRPEVGQAVAALRTAVEAMAGKGVSPGSGRLPGLDGAEQPDLRWLARVEGAWLLPQSWDSATVARENGLGEATIRDECLAGRSAAAKLIAAARQAGIRPPTPYLAVVAQDADHMGQRLGRVPAGVGGGLREWHGKVSTALVACGQKQQSTLETSNLLGWTVYAGGDDLLGFVPVRTALAAGAALNQAFDDGMREVLPGASASTAVVFFHASWPLQSALGAARELLDEAKRAGRPGLGVAALRRGGERVRLARGWQADPPADPGTSSVTCLQTLVDAMRGGLSGRLASSLERDRDHLATLGEDWLARELRRLIRRHSDPASAGLPDPAAVERALRSVSGRDREGRITAEAAVVARFVASEGW